MKKKYFRGGRSGKLHNMAMRMRKNKPERYNPFKDALLKRQLMEQMKLLVEQSKLNENKITEQASETDLPETLKEETDESRTT